MFNLMNDRNMLRLPFLNFPKFPDFLKKLAILGQLWPEIPDQETQLTHSNVLI